MAERSGESATDSEVEARTAAAFARVGPAESLSPQTLAQIGERLRERRERGQSRWHWSGRFAVAAAAVLLAVGGARAAVILYRGAEPASSIPRAIWRALHPHAGAVPGGPPSLALPPPPPASVVPQVPQAAIVQAPVPVAAPAPIAVTTSAPQPHPSPVVSRPAAPAVAAPAPPPVQVGVLAPPVAPTSAASAPAPDALSDAVDQQMEWLQNARRLSADPAAELLVLDGYLKKYPQGLFRAEAQVARVEALLRVGNKAEAIATLDEAHRQGFAGLPRADELAVLRAELLAEAGRCAEVLPELQDRFFSEALAERALYARGYCLSHTGDAAGGRKAFQEYLRRFPEGRFADQARQALGE